MSVIVNINQSITPQNIYIYDNINQSLLGLQDSSLESRVSTSNGGRGSELHLCLLYVLRELIWWSPTTSYVRDRDMVMMIMTCLICLTCLPRILHHITDIRHRPYLELRFLYIVGEPLVRFDTSLHSSDHRFHLCNGFGCLSRCLCKFDANSLCWWRFGGDAANGSDRTSHCSEELLAHSVFLLLLATTLWWVLCHRCQLGKYVLNVICAEKIVTLTSSL